MIALHGALIPRAGLVQGQEVPPPTPVCQHSPAASLWGWEEEVVSDVLWGCEVAPHSKIPVGGSIHLPKENQGLPSRGDIQEVLFTWHPCP